MEPDAYCFHKAFEPSGPAEFQVDRHYLLYAREGSLRLESARQRWTLPPARAALIPANHPISLTVLTRLTTASVLFAPSFLSPAPQALTVFDVSPLARELIHSCRDWGPASGELSAYAEQIFSTLGLVVTALCKQPSPCVLPVPRSAAAARALALTEARSATDVRIEDIARDTGQSSRALARRFAQEMGMTWSETLRRIRLIQAVEALASSDKSVTEIAQSVGYQSLSSFNAAFRELLGMNPSQYRASFKAS